MLFEAEVFAPGAFAVDALVSEALEPAGALARLPNEGAMSLPPLWVAVPDGLLTRVGGAAGATVRGTPVGSPAQNVLVRQNSRRA